MFEPKIKIRKPLLEKAKRAAELQGGVSLEEFVERTIEKEVDRVLSKAGKQAVTEEDVQDIANKLKGLGYLD